jgi:hypothetical protein
VCWEETQTEQSKQPRFKFQKRRPNYVIGPDRFYTLSVAYILFFLLGIHPSIHVLKNLCVEKRCHFWTSLICHTESLLQRQILPRGGSNNQLRFWKISRVWVELSGSCRKEAEDVGNRCSELKMLKRDVLDWKPCDWDSSKIMSILSWRIQGRGGWMIRCDRVDHWITCISWKPTSIFPMTNDRALKYLEISDLCPELGKQDRWKLVLHTLKIEILKFTCQFPRVGTSEHLQSPNQLWDSAIG